MGTPKVDAIGKRYHGQGTYSPKETNELYELSRKLEAVNAELVAALQDLLNTYSSMIDLPVHEINSGVGGKARAAIARATGARS